MTDPYAPSAPPAELRVDRRELPVGSKRPRRDFNIDDMTDEEWREFESAMKRRQSERFGRSERAEIEPPPPPEQESFLKKFALGAAGVAKGLIRSSFVGEYAPSPDANTVLNAASVAMDAAKKTGQLAGVIGSGVAGVVSAVGGGPGPADFVAEIRRVAVAIEESNRLKTLKQQHRQMKNAPVQHHTTSGVEENSDIINQLPPSLFK